MNNAEFVAEIHRMKFPRKRGVRITSQGNNVVRLKARQLGMDYREAKAAPLLLERLHIIGLSTTSPE